MGVCVETALFLDLYECQKLPVLKFISATEPCKECTLLINNYKNIPKKAVIRQYIVNRLTMASITQYKVGSITSRCSGNEPALLPETGRKDRTREDGGNRAKVKSEEVKV